MYLWPLFAISGCRECGTSRADDGPGAGGRGMKSVSQCHLRPRGQGSST